MKPGKNLCLFAKKSKVFKIQNEPDFPFQKYIEPNSHAYSIISRLKGKQKTDSSNYTEPKPIENILKLVFDPYSFSENTVCLDLEYCLPATACDLFNNTRFYLSNGIKLESGITFQFLLGKDVTCKYGPKPLAMVGKNNLEIVKKNYFEELSSKFRKYGSK